MFSGRDTPDDAYWVEVDGDTRIHPYGMHKTVNRRDVEVVHCVSDDENHPRRWVIVRDGEHEAWVMKRYEDEYGYDLTPDEQVSEVEVEAITLKQRAISDGTCVTLAEASAFSERSNDTDVLKHALIAGYYAAKADPDVADEDVDHLRDKVRKLTGHVDLDHQPTVMGILEEHLDGEE